MSNDNLAPRLLDQFRARGWTLALAESCTGGELCARLTAVAGSSDVVVGGVIPYSDVVKTGILAVPPEVIAQYGAVSAEVAQAMAQAVREQLGADVGLAITGIAGPGGARPSKPVGLTFIALSDRFGQDRVERHVWPGDRAANRAHSVLRGLRMLAAHAETGTDPTGLD